MSETRRRYAREFKLEAVRLSEDADRTAAEVARALGIAPRILYRWQQVFKSEWPEAFPGHGKLAGRRGGGAAAATQAGAGDARARFTKKNHRLILAGTMSRYRFIQQHRGQYALRRMCRVLDVWRSGYHAWQDWPLTVDACGRMGS